MNEVRMTKRKLEIVSKNIYDIETWNKNYWWMALFIISKKGDIILMKFSRFRL